MKKVLLGTDALTFLKSLEKINWVNDEPKIKGGVFETEIESLYCAYDSSNGKTFVEEFYDLQEAVKYAMGIQAHTRNDQFI